MKEERIISQKHTYACSVISFVRQRARLSFIKDEDCLFLTLTVNMSVRITV